MWYFEQVFPKKYQPEKAEKALFYVQTLLLRLLTRDKSACCIKTWSGTSVVIRLRGEPSCDVRGKSPCLSWLIILA